MAPPALTANDCSEPASDPSCETMPTVLVLPNWVTRFTAPPAPRLNVTASVMPGIWPAATLIVRSTGAVISPLVPNVSTLSVSVTAVPGEPWLPVTVHSLAADLV